MPIPFWGAYRAKRSQLVAELADQIQDHACQDDAKPVWAALGSHLGTDLVPEIAVWRAANGIKPQDPRRTGENQLETSRPCGNNASTGISRVPPIRQQMRRPTSDRHDIPPLVAATPTGSTRSNSPNGVRAGRSRPADSRSKSRHIAAPEARASTPRGHSRIRL